MEKKDGVGVSRERDFSTRFIELAGEINTSMPQYVVSRACDALNQKGKSVKGSNMGKIVKA